MKASSLSTGTPNSTAASCTVQSEGAAISTKVAINEIKKVLHGKIGDEELD